jgi:mannose-6-phosphate isomerase-like protein (cupin superfamily)
MDVLDKATTPTKIVTPYGETIYELVGRTVGSKTPNHSVAYVSIAPHKSSLRHFHRRTEESYFVIAGEAFVEIGDEQATLRAGQIVLIPAMHPRTRSTTRDSMISFYSLPARQRGKHPMLSGSRRTQPSLKTHVSERALGAVCQRKKNAASF